ncbi:hypothetical protein OG216_09975 [Streptomycetaceae bacterium NBC_01309]
MTRFVEIPADAVFRTEDSDLSRTYVASTPGLPDIRIKVARGAVPALEDCVVGRVGARPVQAWLPPRVPHLAWVSRERGRYVSGRWALVLGPLAHAGAFGWFLTGPGTPEGGLPMGVWSAAPLRAAEAWIHEHRRIPEQFPGERAARWMLRESGVNPDLPDVADPAGDS